MDSRYKTLNTLDLAEVERELTLMIDLVGEDPDEQGERYILSLIKLAKALGSKINW